MHQTNIFNSNSQTVLGVFGGVGPAGVSCALELAFCKLNSLLVERGKELGGQLLGVGELENFAGGHFKDGSSLARNMSRLAEKVKLNVLMETQVQGIETNAAVKKVLIGNDIYKTRAIVIATGVRLKTLEVPGLSLVASHVTYREQLPVQFSNLRVGIVGGGDNALLKALQVAETAAQVYLINRSNKWRCRLDYLKAARESKNIEMLENSLIESLSGVGDLRSACLVDKTTGRRRNLSLDKLSVKIGYIPNTEIFRGQLNLDVDGYIKVDSHGQTSAPGVFAAGDVISGVVPRVATACGTGSTVASMIQLYLGRRQRSELGEAIAEDNDLAELVPDST